MTPARPSSDASDRGLDAALDAFRRDCHRDARAASADALAARVMASLAAGDPETVRFRRAARGYAAAAALLLACGVAGSVHVRTSSAAPRVAPRVEDLTEARLARELSAALSDQPVRAVRPTTGGR